MIKIYYDHEGRPACILVNGQFIPIDQDNADFRKWKTWNSEQPNPVDWQTIVPPPPLTAEELAVIARKAAAAGNALAILNWAKWTEDEAQAWGNTNIGQPLIDGRNNLPATLTLTTARAAIVSIINILDKMWAMQWALARMVIALRDETWPELPNK